MKIKGWECVVGIDGTSRAASHPENGNAVWIQGRLMAHCDLPAEVFEWLVRPRLRAVWESGCVIGLGAPASQWEEEAYALNPFNGEPPNKDKEPS